jgi:hypothetical protein
MTAREEREGESLDDRLAEEEPDVSTEVTTGADAADDGGSGRAHRGQIDGTPEDGRLPVRRHRRGRAVSARLFTPRT